MNSPNKRTALQQKCKNSLRNSNKVRYLSCHLPRSRSPLLSPLRAVAALPAPPLPPRDTLVLHAPVVPSGDPRAPRRPALRLCSLGCHPPCPLLLLTAADGSWATACPTTTQPAAAPSPVSWSTLRPSQWTRAGRHSAPRWSRRRRQTSAHTSRSVGIWGSLRRIVGAVLSQTGVVTDGAVPALSADDAGAGRQTRGRSLCLSVTFARGRTGGALIYHQHGGHLCPTPTFARRATGPAVFGGRPRFDGRNGRTQADKGCAPASAARRVRRQP